MQRNSTTSYYKSLVKRTKKLLTGHLQPQKPTKSMHVFDLFKIELKFI